MLRLLCIALLGGLALSATFAADPAVVPPGPAAPPGPAVPGPAAAPEPEWQKLETQALPISDLHQLLSPGLFDREFWHVIELPKDGSPIDTELPHAGKDKAGKEHPALKARLKDAVIWVDLNADGKPEQNELRQIAPDGLCGPYTTELFYDDGTSAPYTFWFKQTGETKFAIIRGAGRSVEFHGKKIVLLDDNGNGKYNDDGHDTIIVGDQPATFVGKYILIDKDIYEMQVYAAGTRMELRPAPKVDTGTVDLFEAYTPAQKAENLVIHTLIVSGPDGSFSFDEQHHKAKIPAGAYDLVFGLFERTHETVYLKKGEKTSFIVGAGRSAAPRWGAPIVGKFSVENDGLEVLVGAPSFQGVSGERYIPENNKLTPVNASIAQVATDRARIEHINIFGSRRYEIQPDGELKPVHFKPLRAFNDEYQCAVEYTSGIMGRVIGKQRIEFVYKKKAK